MRPSALPLPANGDWSLRSPKLSPLFAAPKPSSLLAVQSLEIVVELGVDLEIVTLDAHLEMRDGFRRHRIWLAGVEELMAQGMHSADQLPESLAPRAADPNNDWHDCKLNHARCKVSQIQFLQDDSPMIQDKSVALSVGEWFFDQLGVSAIDCPYLCDNTCHNLVFK
ncbi:hypothetical protein Syun_025785 [Stephania yunnanensis]|uniref:Pectin acetylesterase n=1 Tax=Stephania yunnanensis TaxID=152371 RepID=A0AAP0ESB3_9MAGN